MHIELTEMVRCPEPHAEAFLVLSTGEMLGRMVRSGMLGCPVCRREFPIVRGVVTFSHPAPGGQKALATPAAAAAPRPPVDPPTLQALLDLSGPGGYVVLLGAAARHAVGLAGLMGGIHFVGVNAPPDVEELPVLSLLVCDTMIPLRHAIARAAVVGPDYLASAWVAEARRVVLPGRRVAVEGDDVQLPVGLARLAAGQGLLVGERR
ncbi:MAG TPA: hypothetical protein VM736_01210 [Gemmatimonadales bacterium]|nr:hypothetical protein [Gemmatimonadales bacterium]